MRDTFRIKGTVTIRKVFTDGTTEEATQDNLIVNNGKQFICHRIGGDPDYAAEKLSAIGFGNDNTAPAITDTKTTTPAWTVVKAGTVSYPAFNQTKIIASIPAEEQIGVTFRDLGALTTSYLMSRIVLTTPIVKTLNFAIQVEWLFSIQ